ncbi:MAG TPA: hypothetical protein PLR07_01420 [Promineifilum sp.]|nr:hypothetical protein [Promineifilum sp.]
MNVSGLLDLLDQIPAFGQLSRALSSEGGAGDLLPLELVRGTRPPVVAQLYRRVATPRQAPIFLLTASGPGDMAARRQQAAAPARTYPIALRSRPLERPNPPGAIGRAVKPHPGAAPADPIRHSPALGSQFNSRVPAKDPAQATLYRRDARLARGPGAGFGEEPHRVGRYRL